MYMLQTNVFINTPLTGNSLLAAILYCPFLVCSDSFCHLNDRQKMHIFNLDLLRLCLDCSDSAQTQLGQVRECKLPQSTPKYQKISSHILGHTQTPYKFHIVPNMCDITYNRPCPPKYAKVLKRYLHT